VEDKTVNPTEILIFLGIEFDTANMAMRLPSEKLRKRTETKDHLLH
jgi:hypothetical protein